MMRPTPATDNPRTTPQDEPVGAEPAMNTAQPTTLRAESDLLDSRENHDRRRLQTHAVDLGLMFLLALLTVVLVALIAGAWILLRHHH